RRDASCGTGRLNPPKRAAYLHRRETPTKDPRNERLVCPAGCHPLNHCFGGRDLRVLCLFLLSSGQKEPAMARNSITKRLREQNPRAAIGVEPDHAAERANTFLANQGK